MQEKVRNEAYRTTAICVDSYENSVMSGRFYNLGQEDDGTVFQSLTQLLIGMEHQLNTANYPQSFTTIRAFVPMSEPRREESIEVPRKRGVVGTFFVKVLFRQHTSWQGTIIWQEGRCEQTFRSVLELILLMDSALSERWEEKTG